MPDQTAPTRRRRTRGQTSPATGPGSADDDASAIVDAPDVDTERPGEKRTRRRPAKGKDGAEDQPKTPSPSPAGDTPELFKTAPHQAGFPKIPDLQRGFQTIVTDIFEQDGYDVKEEWAAVRDGLVITDALTPERLKAAANGQEHIADRAHQLYIVAKVEVQAYMRDTEATYGAIREASIHELEKQKANKTRTKQITDADVKAECARLYPDEWRDICSRRERAEAMLRHIENLAGLAKSRCYTVSNMAHPGNRSV